MDDRYDAYCAVDPLFYDALSGGRRPAREFWPAQQPTPQGWERQVLGEWLAYHPAGTRLPAQGWKIHISAGMDNAERVLGRVWEYCLGQGLAFKFLRGPGTLLLANAKYAPRGASGKFITIYPPDEAALERVGKELSDRLRGETGPYILNDLRWGDGPVYVRYGGFSARFCLDRGEVVPAIENADGVLVPDRRGPVFAVPDWVTLPDFLAPHLAARNATTTAELPYRIERVIHFSNGGGLYVAADTRTGARCVLKEARPYAGLDAHGVDAVTRLRRERDTLVRLADVPQVPRVLDYFPVGDHEFLALEFIDGIPLNKELVSRYPLIDADADRTTVAAYTRWALAVHRQVAEAVAAIHDRGLVYGDLHLFNLLVRPDGQVALVDFEVAAPATDRRRPGLRNQGFAAPSDRTGTAVDEYALACLGLALFLPLTPLVRLVPAAAADLAGIIAEHFPVPRAFLTAAVRTITGDEPPATRRPRALITCDPAGWPAVREQLAGAITASATPERDDRLFPGDIEQFRTGGLTLAYGAAGVLYTLAAVGVTPDPAHVSWLADRARNPKPGSRYGFYDGLHGVAYALLRLGRRDEALNLLDRCLDQSWPELDLDLAGGLAGIGLGLAELADLTGDGPLREAAGRATALVAERLDDAPTPRYAGLTHGRTGPALLLLRQYERTGDPALLDRAGDALRQDLARCVVRADGAMEVDEGWRTMPYLARGSVGIGLVLDQYLAHRPDPDLDGSSAAIRRAARSPFYAQSGLFAGRAGIIHYLTHRGTGDPADRAELDRQVRRLAWHALPFRGHTAFPGEQLLRLSMDLATGTAGVLLALRAAHPGEPVGLPFLSPLRRNDSPAREGIRDPLTSEGGV